MQRPTPPHPSAESHTTPCTPHSTLPTGVEGVGTPPASFHPSVQAAVAKLRRLGVPLLACGQTVFWDEPVKVVLREILDALAPELPMFLGVHDTDYFSRGAPPLPGREGCVALPRNDFSTRGLWAAAGELSVLFGGEVVPSHESLAEAGVSLEKAARAAEQGKAGFLDAITEAWGWKGLVYLGADHPVAGQMPLGQLWEPLVGLLRWGFEASAGFLASDGARRKASQVQELIMGWMGEHRDRPGHTALVALYQRLLPRFCSLLLGREAESLHFFTSSEFFQFNPATAGRPRFSLLSLFLNPETAVAARWAYDGAVHGSGIYELEKFGPGALPFDIVAPGRGRGTLFITASSVRIGFESGEISIPIYRAPESPGHLASVLGTALGKGISLVGKAVVLPLMFSAEFVMMLHQGASVYIPLTGKMHRLLRQQGLPLRIHPILRLRYDTWSSLSATDVCFRLPRHLAGAFQRERISAREFAATWEEVVASQEPLLKHLRQLKTPEELLGYLSTRDAAWKAVAQEWGSAHQALHEIGEWVRCYKMEADSLTAAISRLNAEVAELERQKAALRRQESGSGQQVTTAADTGSQGHVSLSSAAHGDTQGQQLAAEIRARHVLVRQKKTELKHAMAALRKVENGDEAVEARKTIARVEARAELARAYLARDALLVQGLTRANLRPTAWWFPLVDAENRWFREVVRTTELFLEEFDGQ